MVISVLYIEVYAMVFYEVKQLSKLPKRFNTKACVVAFTSFFVLASMTDTLTKHPELRATVVSTGNCVVPHVRTSVALEPETSRVKTNL